MLSTLVLFWNRGGTLRERNAEYERALLTLNNYFGLFLSKVQGLSFVSDPVTHYWPGASMCQGGYPETGYELMSPNQGLT